MNNLMKLFILISIIILGNCLSIKSNQNNEHIKPNSPSELASEEDMNEDLYIGTNSYMDFLESVLSSNKPKPKPDAKNPQIKNKDWLKQGKADIILQLDGTKGYITKKKELAFSNCFKVTSITPGAQKAEINYSASFSSKQMNSTLSAGIGFKSDFTVAPKVEKPNKKRVEEESFAPVTDMKNVTVSLSLNATYNSALVENNLSTSYFYFVKISRKRTFKSDGFIHIKDDGTVKCTFINEEGLNYFDNDFKANHYSEFIDACGNEMVGSVIEGGIFILKTSLVFKSSNDKKKFEGHGSLNVNTDVAALKADAVKKSKETNVSATNKIEVIQFGGDSAKFLTIFPESTCIEELQSSVDGKVGSCSKFTTDATNYIRTQFAQQFIPTQLETYYTFGYSTIANPMLNKILNIK